MRQTMLAAFYDGSPKIKLEERPIPEISRDELLLEVKAVGICGTDLRILKSGHRRIRPGTKTILGHELSGVVHSVGENVEWLKPGMKICIAPNMGCGHCELCIQGFSNLCENYYSFGVVIDGGFAQFMRVPAGSIIQGNISFIPENLSFEEAALIEPLSCAYHGLSACKLQPSETVLVIGAGAIGLMFIQLAKALGAGRVLVSSHSDLRSAQAKQFGADFTFNPNEVDFKDTILNTTDGRGVDIAIIAAPSSEAQTKAIEVLAHHGRVVFFGGLPKDQEMVPLNSNLVHYKELFLTGTTGSTVKEFRTSLSLVANGTINVRDLATQCFPLREIEQAFEYAASKKGLKTIVLPN
jgi:L-iditol 2-dehydrogenase